MNPYIETLIIMALIGWPCCLLFMFLVLAYLDESAVKTKAAAWEIFQNSFWLGTVIWLLALSIVEGCKFIVVQHNQ